MPQALKCNSNLKRIAQCRSLFLIWLLLFPFKIHAQIVITNPDLPNSTLDRNSVRSIFLMRTREWSSGETITVFVLDNSQKIHREFCRNILGIFPYQLQQRWDRLIYSGTGQAPIVLKTESEMMRRVAETKGAIGYISGEKLDSSVNKIDIDDETL